MILDQDLEAVNASLAPLWPRLSGARILMTGGTGFPGGTLLFYSIYLYKQAFQYYNMGYASAMAWLLFTVALLITLVIFRSAKLWVFYGGVELS